MTNKTKLNTQIMDNIYFADAGDKVKLTNGNIYEFVKLKRTKFIGKKDGNMYDIPVTMFVEIVEKAEVKINDGYKTLKKGELFYINKSEKAILYRFDCMKNGYIMGTNVINDGGARIDASLYGGKVSEL